MAKTLRPDADRQRQRTDRSLRVERDETDRVLKRRTSVRDRTDQAVARARGRTAKAPARPERERTGAHLEHERHELAEALRQRDEFLGIVAHDLRNLLGALGLECESILRKLGDSPASRAQAQRVHTLRTHLDRLIGDLVDLASIEAGQLTVLPRRADPAPIVRDAVAAFRPVAAARGIRLRLEARALPHALFDPMRSVQILGNLLSNAIKFTPEGGTVTVRAGRRGEHVVLSVCDTGPGVPAGQRTRIFERFHRLERQGPGLGLGLYISRHLVQQQQGTIWCDGADGGGSTFSFTLPLAR